MGIKRKIKNELNIQHYNSILNIKTHYDCTNCPLKLYANENDTVVFGVGNIMSNIMLVLPSYDTKANIDYYTILNILQDVYKQLKGNNILEDCYITRSIKCFNKTDFNLEKDAIKSCMNYLIYECYRLKPNKIIIFDKNLYDFGLYNNIRGVFNVKTVISPGVMYYDNQKLKNIFMKQLNEAINDT